MTNQEIGLIFKAFSHILGNQEVIMRRNCPESFYLIEDTNELSVLFGQLSEKYYYGENQIR